jgi:hypothetical protein
MSKSHGNHIVHPDGTVHVTKTEVRRAKDLTGQPWTAISRCGIEFELDETIEPSVTKSMIMGIMAETDATCETCRATP